MISSNDPSRSRQRRALLLFADCSQADCRRRGWPAAFRILFEARNLSFGPGEGFDQHLFTGDPSRRLTSSHVEIHNQEGSSFGQRLQNAVETLARLGYEQIVIIGQDCPDLEPVDIRHSFALLDTHRLVLGPDHRGGCYLIGLHARDAERLNRVQWQRNTDFCQICARFVNESVFALPTKIDLDTIDDIWLLAGSKSPFRLLAEALLDLNSNYFASESNDTSPQVQEQRVHWQLPPPTPL